MPSAPYPARPNWFREIYFNLVMAESMEGKGRFNDRTADDVGKTGMKQKIIFAKQKKLFVLYLLKNIWQKQVKMADMLMRYQQWILWDFKFKNILYAG